MKVYNYEIVFSEFPDEVTLALNISNCPCHCKGCHSPYLAKDLGDLLTKEYLLELIHKNVGITCIGIMGGDSDPYEVLEVARWINEYNRENQTSLKIGWYSGRDNLPPHFDIGLFDYIKIGRYDQERGPLNKTTTNQYMVKYHRKYNEVMHEWQCTGRELVTEWFQTKKI